MEDDLTHYVNACARLSREVVALREQLVKEQEEHFTLFAKLKFRIDDLEVENVNLRTLVEAWVPVD